MEIIGGRAVVTINSDIRIEFTVPHQMMGGNFIIIPNIQNYLNE
jgi:hypothetical protein